MNYKKYIYRNLSSLVEKAKLYNQKTGKDLTVGFSAALKKHDLLINKVEKLFTDARKGGYDIANTLRWSKVVHEACDLRNQAEKILRDNVRPYLGKQYAHVHVLVGYCPQTIPYYQKMIKELKTTFPEAQAGDVLLGQVKKSNCVKGFTLISWSGEIKFDENDCAKGELFLPKNRKGGKNFYISENCEYSF